MGLSDKVRIWETVYVFSDRRATLVGPSRCSKITTVSSHVPVFVTALFWLENALTTNFQADTHQR